MGNKLSSNNYNKIRYLTKNDVEDFKLKDISFKCKVVDVYDGNTCKIIFKYKGKINKWNLHLEGYDVPNLKPRLNDPKRDEKIAKATLFKDYLENIVLGYCCIVKCNDYKRGDIIGELYLENLKNISVNYLMKIQIKNTTYV